MNIRQISQLENTSPVEVVQTENKDNNEGVEQNQLENYLTDTDVDSMLVQESSVKASAGKNKESFSVTSLLGNTDLLKALNKSMTTIGLDEHPNNILNDLNPDSFLYKFFGAFDSKPVHTTTGQGMDGWTLSHLAYMDSNADGCISESEQAAEADTFIRGTISFEADGGTAKCMGEFRTEHYGVTTLNGQKVYALSTYGYDNVFNNYWPSGNICETISLTESELEKLSEYYEKYGENADIEGALKAMGISGTTKNINGRECLCFTGASGVESVIVKTDWFKNTRKFGPSYSNALWCAYNAMKKPEFTSQRPKGMLGAEVEAALGLQSGATWG